MNEKLKSKIKDEKEYVKIILFGIVLGTFISMQWKSSILLVGLAMLIYYTQQKFNLTINEIISCIVAPAIIGLAVNTIPYILVFFQI